MREVKWTACLDWEVQVRLGWGEGRTIAGGVPPQLLPPCHPRTWITRDWLSNQVLYVPFKNLAELLREGGGEEGRGGEGERGKGKRDFYSLIPRDPL